jgi:uncharacterized protein (UPF0303 family)
MALYFCEYTFIIVEEWAILGPYFLSSVCLYFHIAVVNGSGVQLQNDEGLVVRVDRLENRIN